MPRGQCVLRKQARKMIYEVVQFMKKEAEHGIQINLEQVQKRAATATGVSMRTVQRIVADAKSSGTSPVFHTPGKKRIGTKRVTGIDSFDKGVIKRCVQNFHKTENQLPSLKLLQQKLKKDIDFNGSVTSLGRIVKELGFRWKKSVDERKILIEKTKIRLLRIEYLQKITAYRAEGRPIIYTDESYVDSSHTTSKAKAISKGQRVVIVHAGSDAGFIPNALLMFKVDLKSGDYLDIMSSENYETWIRSQLMPNLPSRSVVVVDNASYHNRLENPAPTPNARKAEMEGWLREKGVPFNSTQLKPELYNLIRTHKDQNKKFYIDGILAENDHVVLRLPPNHPDLNPIEMAWGTIKEYIACKNVNWNTNTVMKLVQEKVNAMGENDWSAFCRKVISIEDEYKKNDVVIDELTEELNIHLGDSESDSESDDGEASDSSDDGSDSAGETVLTSREAINEDSDENDEKSNEELMKHASEIRSYYEQEVGGWHRCVICRATRTSSLTDLMEHLKEKHPKLLAEIEQVVSDSGSEGDKTMDTYTEIVYLEEEERNEPTKSETYASKSSAAKRQKIEKTQKEKKSSEDAPVKRQTPDDEELESFVKYITCLLKQVPKDTFGKLQMDIVNLIMNAKLNYTVTHTNVVYENVIQNVDNMSMLITKRNEQDSGKSNVAVPEYQVITQKQIPVTSAVTGTVYDNSKP